MISGQLILGQSPIVDITIQGVFEHNKQYKAIIDTGFTGYAQIPLIESFGLALVLSNISTATLADGSLTHSLLCWGRIYCGEKMTNGFISLSQGGKDILLGMQWLKAMEMELRVDACANTVCLAPADTPGSKESVNVAVSVIVDESDESPLEPS